MSAETTRGAPDGLRDRVRGASPTAIWTGVAALMLALGVLQILRRSPAVDRPDPAAAAAAAATGVVIPPPPRPPPFEGPQPETLTTPAEIRTAARTADETILLLEDQVRRLREYAAMNGPDDPFALTEEQIQEFRRRGDPIIW